MAFSALKRKRSVKACLYCHKSHVICDGKRPCERCQRRGISQMCRDIEQDSIDNLSLMAVKSILPDELPSGTSSELAKAAIRARDFSFITDAVSATNQVDVTSFFGAFGLPLPSDEAIKEWIGGRPAITLDKRDLCITRHIYLGGENLAYEYESAIKDFRLQLIRKFKAMSLEDLRAHCNKRTSLLRGLHKHLSITDMPLLVTLSSTEIVLISDSLAEMIGCKRTALTSCRLSVFDLFALESLPVILKECVKLHIHPDYDFGACPVLVRKQTGAPFLCHAGIALRRSDDGIILAAVFTLLPMENALSHVVEPSCEIQQVATK